MYRKQAGIYKKGLCQLLNLSLPQCSHGIVHLAGATSAAWDVLAAGVGLTTGDVDILPGPVSARAIAAENVDVISIAFHGARDAIHGEVRDGDTIGRGAGRRAVLVVLLNDDAVLRDTRDRDVLVGDISD
jgi:hypothetical protein